MNEALVVTMMLKIRQIFVVFLCLARGNVGHTDCLHTVLPFFVTFVTIFTGRQGQLFILCFLMQKQEESDSGEGLHPYNESSKMASFCQMI